MRVAVRPRSIVLPLVLLVAAIAAAVIVTGLPAPAQAAERTAVPAAASVAAVRKAVTHAAYRYQLIAELAAEVPRERLAAKRIARAATRQATRTRIVEVAHKQLGDRYAAGSSGPAAFDCSGLVRYVYKQVTGKELPHYSGAQYARATKITKAQARPGDLVFFLRGGAHHVGIYIGKNKMIDAAGYGEGVRISPISGSWWSRAYTGMGRILPA